MRRVALAVLLLLMVVNVPYAAADQKGVRVVATFSNLVHDLKLIACPNDEIDYIAPPGLDPHDYEMKPSDLIKLREADLVVSTAHTPFEVSIRELVSRGEIRAKLVEVPSLKGISILENPSTGQPNYHMPIYDPSNYLKFMEAVRDVLKELNPACSEVYDRKYRELERRVESLVVGARKVNAIALASTPTAQYALEWLGVKVRFLLMKDEGLPATPRELSEIYRAARSGEIGLVVTVGDENTPANLKAIELAKEFGIRKVNVPSPLEQRSIPDKLHEVILSLEGEGSRGESVQVGDSTLLAILTLASAILITLAYLRRRGA